MHPPVCVPPPHPHPPHPAATCWPRARPTWTSSCGGCTTALSTSPSRSTRRRRRWQPSRSWSSSASGCGGVRGKPAGVRELLALPAAEAAPCCTQPASELPPARPRLQPAAHLQPHPPPGARVRGQLQPVCRVARQAQRAAGGGQGVRGRAASAALGDGPAGTLLLVLWLWCAAAAAGAGSGVLLLPHHRQCVPWPAAGLPSSPLPAPTPDLPAPAPAPAPSPAVSLLQRQILDKLREHEKEVDKEVQEIIDERRRWRDKMVRAAGAPRGCGAAGLVEASANVGRWPAASGPGPAAPRRSVPQASGLAPGAGAACPHHPCPHHPARPAVYPPGRRTRTSA